MGSIYKSLTAQVLSFCDYSALFYWPVALLWTSKMPCIITKIRQLNCQRLTIWTISGIFGGIYIDHYTNKKGL